MSEPLQFGDRIWITNEDCMDRDGVDHWSFKGWELVIFCNKKSFRGCVGEAYKNGRFLWEHRYLIGHVAMHLEVPNHYHERAITNVDCMLEQGIAEGLI